ncbi:alpha/beta hydrolase [Kineosporia sp. NBRC 101731]|uniref:alpha/beta hydrolase n=1 Tax=Kineosporia sp. NBRC 101731 TaxID=3032199 RepID=UPI0024A454C0|nr:alpha/beta hydrolase [Kineosporia sp. NBRC 101731]GLY29025.1 hypothetical protein Kisp02_23900 [Kineosporia sp. NBRC 101731]
MRPHRNGDLRFWRAIEYATVPGFRPLLLDVYRPDTRAAVPAVIFVHGGGWHVGSRASVGPTYADWLPSPLEQLAGKGFAVISVDYRLTGEARFPAQLDDVTAAAAWVRDRTDELGIDPRRIAVWGESAGGHLAALLGLTAEGVAAVVDWYGPSDLARLPTDAAELGISVTDPSAADSREASLLGGRAAEVPELAAQASPVARVHENAPPFLLIHGTADRFVPHRQSERLADALRAQRVDVRLRLLEGADHLWLGSPETARTAFDLTVEFLRERLA